MNLSKDEIRKYNLPLWNEFNYNNINQNLIIENIIGEYNYQINSSKSSSKWLVVKNTKDDTILIINRKNNTFFNQYDKTGGGSYVFLQNHLFGNYQSKPNLSPFDKRTIFVIAHKLLNLTEYKKTNSLQRSSVKINKPLNFEIKNLFNTDFLLSKKISDETLNHSYFLNRIFNSLITFNNSKTIINTAFPLFYIDDFKTIKGWISRNKPIFNF